MFGGSGKVLVNCPEEWKKIKVYNDINKDLYTTFKVFQDDRKRRLLKRKLRLAFPHENIFQEMRKFNPKMDVDVAFKPSIFILFHMLGQDQHLSGSISGQTFPIKTGPSSIFQEVGS